MPERNTMNMPSITVEQFTREIMYDIEDGNYNPVVGIGVSGIGKTQGVHEMAVEKGLGFKEIRLVNMTEVDLAGVPTVQQDETSKRLIARWAQNGLLPIEGKDEEEGLLVLDEITSATSPVRATAYQLLDSQRGIGEYKLPKKWKVVALGNGPDDGGVFQGMEGAFLNRAVAYRVECDADVWRKWAFKKGIHSSIIAFIAFAPQMIHDMNPEEIAEVFPSPRSWTILNQLISNRERRFGRKLTLDEARLYSSSCVGVKAGEKFAAFYEMESDMVSIPDILAGKKVMLSNAREELVYMTISNLTAAVLKEIPKDFETIASEDPDNTNPELVRKIAYAFKWVHGLKDMPNGRKDYSISGIKDLLENISGASALILCSDIFDEIAGDCIEDVQDMIENIVNN